MAEAFIKYFEFSDCKQYYSSELEKKDLDRTVTVDELLKYQFIRVIFLKKNI